MEKNNFDWTKGFTLPFSMENGLSDQAVSTKRYLSNMKDMYYNSSATSEILETNDPMIYEFYELGAPEEPGALNFGTSITYPGKVGDEYYMTKGHFHTIIDTAEVYYCLSGEGYLMLENPEGDVIVRPLAKGVAVYVPPYYAHRSINTGETPLVTFFAFRGDAGHNYGTIEEKGYHKLIVEMDGKPTIIDNPKWNG